MRYKTSLHLLAYLVLFAGCTNNAASSSFQKAEDLWKKGLYNEAVAQYGRIVSDYPRSNYSPVSLYKKGIIQSLYLLNYGHALDSFKKLIVLYPESKEAPLAKRQIADINMYNLKNYEKAIMAYQQLTDEEILDDPDAIQLNIALAYLKSDDFEQGRIEFHYLMNRFPSSSLIARAYFEIANSYLLEGEKELAIDNYRKIVKFYPASKYFVDSKYGIAVALEEQGNLRQAMTLYKDLEGEYTNPPAIKVRIASLEKRLKSIKRRR